MPGDKGEITGDIRRYRRQRRPGDNGRQQETSGEIGGKNDRVTTGDIRRDWEATPAAASQGAVASYFYQSRKLGFHALTLGMYFLKL